MAGRRRPHREARVFDLGSTYSISSALIWQYNATCCGLNRGVRQLKISTSSDGIMFAPATTTTLTQSPGGSIPAQTVAMAVASARYIAFDIISDWGDPDYVGLSEVRFEAGPAAAQVRPAPVINSVGLGCLVGLLLLVGLRKMGRCDVSMFRSPMMLVVGLTAGLVALATMAASAQNDAPKAASPAPECRSADDRYVLTFLADRSTASVSVDGQPVALERIACRNGANPGDIICSSGGAPDSGFQVLLGGANSGKISERSQSGLHELADLVCNF